MKHEKTVWTVMIYLAGDNDLSPEMIRALQRMKDAERSRKVNVIVALDTIASGARFFQLNRSRFAEIKIDRKLPSRSVAKDEIARQDSGKEKNSLGGLRDLLAWGVEDFPAEHYMLILFGHGPIIRGAFLQDSNPPSYLNLTDFSHVLAQFFGEKKKRKLDVLGLHNCVMNGIEFIYQLRETVDYVLGSQGLVLRVGWPYQRLLNAITVPLEHGGAEAATPAQVAARLLRVCAKHNFDFYQYMSRSFEQALCRTRRADELAAALNGSKAKPGLARLLTHNLELLGADDKDQRQLGRLAREAVNLARLETQSFWQSQFVDLHDFCSLLSDKCRFFMRLTGGHGFLAEELDKIADACDNVKQALENTVKGAYYLGPERQYANGLSVYFPWAQPMDTVVNTNKKEKVRRNAFAEYNDCAFAKDARWGKFLTAYFAATLRATRDQDGATTMFPTAAQFKESISMAKSNFEVDKSNFEVDKSNFEVDKSNFEVDKSNFEVGKSNFEVGKSNFEVGKSNFEVGQESCGCTTTNFPNTWQRSNELQQLLNESDEAILNH